MRSLFLLTVVLAACTSGTPGSSEPGSPAGTGAAPTAVAGGGATAAPQDDAGPSFGEVVRNGKLANYKVAYKLTMSGTGGPQSFDQTWYFKPPKARFDMTSDDGYGSTLRMSMFFLENGTFMCSEESSGKSCFQISADAADGQNLGFAMQDDFRNDPAAFNATLRETRTIAGQQAFCYLVRGGQAFTIGEGTFCYTRTGVPLLSRWALQGTSFSIEATAFSATVPDSDFALPITPIRVP